MQYIRTPQGAEQNAAIRMREMGFSDALVTGNGSDGGIDVRASHAVAQVKWRGGMVGRPELQNLFGARGSDYTKKHLFFAASDYSQHALDYAEGEGIALFVYEPHGSVIAKNSHAAALTAAGHGTVGRASWAPARASNSVTGTGFWSRTVWPFLKVHWRIVGAVVLTIAIPGGVGSVINPDEAAGQTRASSLVVLIFIIALAVLFWRLYFTERARRQAQCQ
ncbi:restriction endonuclease [Nocardia nova]|uniref:restriction endonuclease n=1 Tax=Nocardia nova TaxID=37330 RepID=UPI002739CE1C|nr:restriction endonuclease [Nocardia nova]